MFNQKKITKSGSVSIPVAMRRDMGLQPGDVVDVVMEHGTISLTPAVPRCQFCGAPIEETKLILNGKHICGSCIQAVYDAFKDEGGVING